MEKDKIIKGHKPNFPNEPWIWSLPNIRGLTQYFNREHELDCADLFVSYFDKFSYWDYEWTPQERADYCVDDFKVYYDRRMGINGKMIFWEVDRGTEEFGIEAYKIEKEEIGDIRQYGLHERGNTLIAKIGKYVRFADEYRDLKFCVLFTVGDYRYRYYDEAGTIDRVELLVKLLRQAKGKLHWAVAIHKDLIAEPYGAHILHPYHPDEMTIHDLTGLY